MSLQSKRFSRVFSDTFKSINSSAIIFRYSLTLTSIHYYWKNHTLTRQTFVDQVMPLLFIMLSRLVIAFLLRSKPLLISWLQSPSAVILEPPKIKFVTISIVSPSICQEVMGLGAMILVFWMLSFKPTFSLSHFHQEALYFFFTFCHKGGVIYISEVIDISPWNLDSSLCFILPSISDDVLCIWYVLCTDVLMMYSARKDNIFLDS